MISGLRDDVLDPWIIAPPPGNANTPSPAVPEAFDQALEQIPLRYHRIARSRNTAGLFGSMRIDSS